MAMDFENCGSVLCPATFYEPENNPVQREVEEDFKTVRAYFDRDEHLNGEDGILTVVIGKLFDRMVELYGGGERQSHYEQVLRTIKAVLLSPASDYRLMDSDFCRESLERVETTLMDIATAKTNTTETESEKNRHQNSDNDEDHIVGMAEKLPAYFWFNDHVYLRSSWPFHFRRQERAFWVVFHHLVKMDDDGKCTSLYKSVLSLVYKDFYTRTHENRYGMPVEELVRKLDEILLRIKKTVGLSKQKVMGDNASALTGGDRVIEGMMRWAMSNRLIIQEAYFMDEQRETEVSFVSKEWDWYFNFGLVAMLYDHIAELDGGGCRYQYMKAFRELFKQLRSENITEGGDDWIDPVQDMFKQIAIKKRDITELKHQEVYKSVKKHMWREVFKEKSDDGVRIRRLKLLAKQILQIYHHLLILDGYECLEQYEKAFELISEIYLVTLSKLSSSGLSSQVFEEVEILCGSKCDLLCEWLKEIAKKKNNNKSNTLSKQKENTVAGTEEARSASFTVPNHGDADIREVLQPRHQWLDSSEILQILQNFKNFRMSEKIQQKPPSGSLILYDTKTFNRGIYKKDGYNWKKQKDGQTVTEGHMRLKVGGNENLHCYYAQIIDDDKFQRRTYSLLDKSSIRLVHYLDVKGVYINESENVGREAADNPLDVTRHNRVNSSGTSSRSKKRQRRDSDGDDNMNKEIDNQVHFPQNANRSIAANTSSLDDEMVLLAKEVGSLPGFDRGSDWFISAMVAFTDDKNKALFKAMEDPSSKVKILKKILKL